MTFSKVAQEYFLNRRVLVFGGAGFIGSNIVDALTGLQSRIVVIDSCEDRTGGAEENLKAS